MSEEVSVILNVYKRPHLTNNQIAAVLSQSHEIKPENIHIWYNYSGVAQFLPKNKKINTYVCNWNTKFFGRFTIPLLCRTPYVAMFDDDMLPPTNWIKNCVESINKTNGIYGGSGVILKSNAYHPYIKVGWNGKHDEEIRRVDLVGHSWFFRQESTKFLWEEKPVTWDNGEDIMFSYLCQKYGKLNTFVPPHPDKDKSLWSTDPNHSIKSGSDGHASWRQGNHLGVRSTIVQQCIKNGWKTINN